MTQNRSNTRIYTMTDRHDGGPAFPGLALVFDPKSESPKPVDGMSLRDWFAGQALQGMNAADRRWDGGNKDMACAAYSQADAMLAARSEAKP